MIFHGKELDNMVVTLLSGFSCGWFHYNHARQEETGQMMWRAKVGLDVLDDPLTPRESTPSVRKVVETLRGNHTKRPDVHGGRVASLLAALAPPICLVPEFGRVIFGSPAEADQAAVLA
jgi:hypothetical protein